MLIPLGSGLLGELKSGPPPQKPTHSKIVWAGKVGASAQLPLSSCHPRSSTYFSTNLNGI